MAQPSKQYLTTAQAAARLGVSPRRVRQYIAKGRIEAELFGGRYVVSRDSVESFAPMPYGNPGWAGPHGRTAGKDKS